MVSKKKSNYILDYPKILLDGLNNLEYFILKWLFKITNTYILKLFFDTSKKWEIVGNDRRNNKKQRDMKVWRWKVVWIVNEQVEFTFNFYLRLF